jgi:hypothetical protein
MELLIARTGGAQRELFDAVAAERRMRVAVDEPRDRAEPAGVDLLDVAVDTAEVAHPSDGRDAALLAEQVRVLEHVDRA